MFKWVQGPNCNSVATACVALHEVTHILKLDGYLCWFYGFNYRSSPDNYQKKTLHQLLDAARGPHVQLDNSQKA